MTTRRNFLRKSIFTGTAVAVGLSACENSETSTAVASASTGTPQRPVLVSTWNHGLPANERGWEVLQNGGSILDAVEEGVKVVEADPKYNSVGYGGLPDREGIVTLDACIMDAKGNCGAVCFLQNIKHPISVARRVMEKTPHVMLAGQGAKDFALAEGFPEEELLTEASRERWQEWLKSSEYKPVANSENHDTIGMLGIDGNGDLAGSCTTSGMAYKIHGRVGDSPIIGAGLFVDNEVGGAVATGVGELVMKTLGSFLVVELMRQGQSPQAACEAAIRRIADKYQFDGMQVGFLALNKQGEVGGAALEKGFNYAVKSEKEEALVDAVALQ